MVRKKYDAGRNTHDLDKMCKYLHNDLNRGNILVNIDDERP